MTQLVMLGCHWKLNKEMRDKKREREIQKREQKKK
jgi:hypothetical protein